MKCQQKWTLIICFSVHTLFLLSVFDIYFTSPIVLNVSRIDNDLPAPAKRLVLFVGDGLRVDTFYEIRRNSTLVPYLRDVIEKRGRWGISHTKVPTESRPGHVAIIAGLYEDPSAIFKGWKDYPTDFDSVFNQSGFTFGWGSPDIMSIFDKGAPKQNIFLESYSSSLEEFTGNEEGAIRTSLWTLDKFKNLLHNSRTNDTLKKNLNSDQLIFFFHLLGIDTVGHSHKPHSKEYAANTRIADEIVRDVEDLIQNFYRDNETAFIFTSDHGMTDWGSHGEGSDVETQTPFVAWGAGINLPSPIKSSEKQPEEWQLSHLQRDDLSQTDIAPLMSILLGISIPVNSLGTIPMNILNSSIEYKSFAYVLNARQILAQFLQKKLTIEKTTFKWLYKSYNGISSNSDEELRKIYGLLEVKLFEDAIKLSSNLILDSLTGFMYYQNYYQNILLFFIASAFVGWICWLILNVTVDDSLMGIENRFLESRKRLRALVDTIFIGLVVITSSLLFAQFLPHQYHLYCNLPFFIWWSVIRKLVSYYRPVHDRKSIYSSLVMFTMVIIGTEFVVLSFFERRALCVVIVGLLSWPWLSGAAQNHSNRGLIIAWTFSCLSLIIFPFLPIVGSSPNDNYIISCFVSWVVLISISWTYLTKISSTSRSKLKIFSLPCILFVIALFNVLHVSSSYSSKSELSNFNKLLSWIFLVAVPVLPLLSSKRLIIRLLSIYFCFGVVSFLFSLTHDALFLPLFCVHLLLWLLFENERYNSNQTKYLGIPRLFSIKFSRVVYQNRNLTMSDFRSAYVFFFYVVFSFFATGNIASINSFDTRSIRCFITVFSPFTMMILLLIKLMIPFLVTASTFRAVNVICKVPVDRIFLIVLVYCNLMGMNFLFLVKNVGSWLEIGSSVSHYVISQTFTLFLVFLYFLSNSVTHFKIYGMNLWKLSHQNKARYIE